ncbi:MAG TPA: hypothetical protein VKA70_05750 [Blastocatellia bacterium]|nr:hypothetical protein [Blastocatellia bacterium]
MDRAAANEATIRRYLLGEAQDEEMEQTEQRLLADRDYFQSFLRLEEELIDEYVRGALDDHDRERFENYFAKAPERRESIEFGKALSRYVSQEAVPTTAGFAFAGQEPSAWRQPSIGLLQSRSRAVMASLVCIALLLVACAGWLLAERTRLRRQVEQLQSERAEAARSEEELERQIEQQEGYSGGLLQRLNQAQSELDKKDQEIAKIRESKAAEQSAAGVISMLLAPELRRGEDEPSVVHLSKSGGRLRLKMGLAEAGYKSYLAEVRTAEGAVIMRSGKLKAKRSRGETVVEVESAADRFAQGDYMVSLSGATGAGVYEKIATYHFRVVRRHSNKPQ